MGRVSSPIYPDSGLPPGDPTSMRMLAMVLAPWHQVVQQVSGGQVKSWAYADDRSMKAKDEEELKKAQEATTEWAAKVGLQENVKKRQNWSKE